MTGPLPEPEVFVLADRAIDRVVAQIRDDQWSMVLPPNYSTRDPGPATLRDIINHHAYDDAWVPDMLAGRTIDEVGSDAWKGDVLGDDPKAAFHEIVERAVAAAEAVTDLEGPVHCSFGDYTAQEFFWQANSFRCLRAHDLAVVIGVQPELPAELVESVWDELLPVADAWREIGVFDPRVPVPDDAPLLDRLLGLTGRQPPHD